jgi:hypothetical protein
MFYVDSRGCAENFHDKFEVLFGLGQMIEYDVMT